MPNTSIPSSSKNHGITNHNPVDIHVGKQIRHARILIGWTQTQLADALKVTFQQVQKYERGANRVSASRLWDLSQILGVEVGFFFDGMKDETIAASPRLIQSAPSRLPRDMADLLADPIERRETLELLRSYYLIKSPHLRKKMSKMIKSATDDAEAKNTDAIPAKTA